MSRLRQFFARVRGLLAFGKRDADMSEEMDAHLAVAEQEHLRRGLPPEEARFAAKRDFGGVEQVKETYRERRGLPVIETLLQDLRFGARMLRKNPGFTAVAVLTLALGIGANSAIFSLVNGVLLRPLPYAQPDRLMTYWNYGMPKGAFFALRDRMQTADLAGYSFTDGYNVTVGDKPVRLLGARISVNAFSILGVQPQFGRDFVPDEEVPAHSHVVILTHGLWQQLYGNDETAVGKSITIEAVPFQIVGIMPEGFHFPSAQTQFLLPITADPGKTDLWGAFMYQPLGRLHPGVTLAQNNAEYHALIPSVVKLYPWKMPDHYVEWTKVTPLDQSIVNGVQTKLYLLLGAVGLVLLIACANVANLLLMRAASRQREIAVRRAMGATRLRLLRQLLTESVLLALAGGALGVALAAAGVRGLKGMLPADTPRIGEAALDWRVVAFTAALALVTGLIFGLAPALRAARSDIETALRGNSAKAGASRSRRRLSSALVVSEAALMVVLMVSAGLLMKSLWRLYHAQTGMRTEHLLTAMITPVARECTTGDQCVGFFQQVRDRTAALPGVEDAALTDKVPFDGVYFSAMSVEDRPEFRSSAPLSTYEFTVSPGYLKTMGIPLLAGRDFNDGDRVGAPPVVVVSRSLAEYVWPGQNPIGKHIMPSWLHNWCTVVGIAADIREYVVFPDDISRVHGDIYFSTAQGIMTPPDELELVARTTGDPRAVEAGIRQIVASIRGNVPVSKVRTMDQIISQAASAPRSTASIFALFAVLALALGAIGIYSVVSYSVAERTQEIGVRVAIGAQRDDVLRLVLGQGMRLAAVGIAIGLVAAAASSRLLTSLLYSVAPIDGITYAGVALLLCVVAALACYVPARRAMRVDPVIALRYE
jgi:predicted permease